MFRHRCQKIVFFTIEHRDIGGRTRRDNAHHFAAHQFFARTGLLHLVANGNLKSRADQPRNVALCSVIGHTAHGDGLAFFAVARGQRDLQFARRGNRIFVK